MWSMEDAWRVFCKMPSQDVVTWTAMISGYVRCGQGQKALELYKRMQQEGVQPNAVTFVVVFMHVLVYLHLKRADGLIS